MSQTTVFLVKRNEQFQLLRILPGGKDVVDGNGNEMKFVSGNPSRPRWFDTIGWLWEEVIGQTMVIEGDLPDGGLVLVQRNDLFKILLILPVEGGDAVDNRGRKYRSGKSFNETGRAGTWWCGRTGQVWREIVEPPPPVKPQPKEIGVFTVEEKTYVDQWGFERTEKIPTNTRRLFLDTTKSMTGMAHDSRGNRFVECLPGSGQWYNLSGVCEVWYSSYPGQLMKRTRISINATNLTMRIRNRTARGGVVRYPFGSRGGILRN